MTYPNIIPSGTNLLPYASGASNIGSSSQYFGTIYANNIVQTGVSNQYLNVLGGSVSGDIILTNGAKITSASNLALSATGTVSISGASVAITAPTITFSGSSINHSGQAIFSNTVLPVTSGTTDLGSTGLYFKTLYVNNIVQTGTITMSGPSVKAWANFYVHGGVASISGSSNVSSVTYNTTGWFTVNYTTPIGNNTYAPVVTEVGNYGGGGIISTVVGGSGIQSTLTQLRSWDTYSSGQPIDPASMILVVVD